MDDSAFDALLDQTASDVAVRFRGSGVRSIVATPYADSFGRSGTHFVVVLANKADEADYTWDELKPVERALAEALQGLDPTRIPYTDYMLESDLSLRREEVA